LSKLNLIAFAGLKGSGKDTAAGVFVRAGYEHVKMAGALKAMLRTLLQYQGTPEAVIEWMIDGDLKEACSTLLGAQSARHAMQTLGTEWGRNCMAEDFWVQMTRNRIQTCGKNVVISDIRFPNEVDMVQRLGGKVFRIDRSDRPANDLHPSEAQIFDLAVDGVVDNYWASALSFRLSIGLKFKAELAA
jgi:hypothetical protein